MSKLDISHTPDRESTPDINHFISDKLNGAIFSGWYNERIWIEDLKSFRDQIQVDDEESQMQKILKSVNRRVRKIRPGFTGIKSKYDALNELDVYSVNYHSFG